MSSGMPLPKNFTKREGGGSLLGICAFNRRNMEIVLNMKIAFLDQDTAL